MIATCILDPRPHNMLYLVWPSRIIGGALTKISKGMPGSPFFSIACGMCYTISMDYVRNPVHSKACRHGKIPTCNQTKRVHGKFLKQSTRLPSNGNLKFSVPRNQVLELRIIRSFIGSDFGGEGGGI